MIISTWLTMKDMMLTALLAAVLAPGALAQAPASWRELGLMQGSPPAVDKRVSKANWLAPPFNRWAFQNVPRVHTTAVVSRGSGPVRELPRASLDLDGITYRDDDGVQRTFRDMLEMTYTDGIVVLQDGKIVYERYFNGMQPEKRHILFSATKSLCGTMTAMLAYEGIIDPSQRTGELIPELTDSAFGDTTIRQIMNMTTGIRYSEDYAELDSEVVAHMVAASYRPFPAGYTGPESLQSFLPGLSKEGEHGWAFHYVSANTEALGWIVERATSRSSVELFSELFLSRIGAERDGLIIVDRTGFPSWGGGFACTTRDFARFGQMILDHGMVGARQVVPAQVIQGFHSGADRTVFSRSSEGQPGESMEGWSYRDQWWVSHNGNGAFTALGIYGQWCYVDPAARMVIAKHSSFTAARGRPLDNDTTYAFAALGEHLAALR